MELGKEPWGAQVSLVRKQRHRAPGLLGNQALWQRVYFAGYTEQIKVKAARIRSYDNWEMAHAARK